ncbi:MAG: InlB B-repeat-containing protein [Eubacterium sp.]
MKRENAWRKGADRLLVLIFATAVIVTFSFTSVMAMAWGGRDDNQNGGSSSNQSESYSVYIYAKLKTSDNTVVWSAKTSDGTVQESENKDGWITLGKISASASGWTVAPAKSYMSSDDGQTGGYIGDFSSLISKLTGGSSVSYYNGSTSQTLISAAGSSAWKLLTANGATDYSDEAPGGSYAWHLNGTINVWTVTYDLNGGSGSVTDTTGYLNNAEASIQNADGVKKAGYTLTGWKDQDGNEYGLNDTVKMTKNITLTAQWTKKDNVTVTYDGNGGKTSDKKTSFTDSVTPDIEFSAADNQFSRAGYTFTGWNTKEDGSGTSYTPGTSLTVTEATTLYAQWTKKNNVTITYDGNGGKTSDGSGTVTDSVQPESSFSIKGNPFNRPGYTFTGWNTKEDGTGTSYEAGKETSVTEATTLYAQWKASKYTIIYTDGVDGEEVFADQTSTVKYGENTPAYSGTPKRDNYVFAGWSPSVSKTVTGNATYTATWKADANNNNIPDDEEEKYTVTYSDGANGTVFADQVTTDLLSGAATPAFNGGIVPKRTGYVFAGWNPVPETTVTKSAAYVAQWKVDANNNGTADDEEQKYTVTYKDGADQSVFKDEVHSGLLAKTATPAFGGTLNRDGYTFAGWKDQDGNTVQDPTKVNVSGDTVYTAQWTKNETPVTEHTVTFHYNDGKTADSTTKVEDGKELSKPSDPVRDGYTFDGWYTDEELTTKYDFTKKVTDDMSLYAKWTKNDTTDNNSGNNSGNDSSGGTSDNSGSSSGGSSNNSAVTPSTPAEEHTVTFHYNDDKTADTTQTVPSGGQAVMPDDPARDGYTFDGWYTDKDLTTKYDFSKSVTSDFTLYAKWTKSNTAVKPSSSKSSKVTGILLPKVIATGKHTQTLTWTALKNVDGYFIYTNHCDKADKEYPFKKVATYKASKARVYKVKNLKTGDNYKYYVAAYKIKNGKKVVVRNSVTVHSVAGNTSSRSTNVKSVKAKKHSITLKKGKSYTLKASISKMNKKKAFLDSTHCGLLRYLSADSKIATVDYNTGKITAKKAGKTTVYVLGVNGIRDKAVVTVK